MGNINDNKRRQNFYGLAALSGFFALSGIILLILELIDIIKTKGVWILPLGVGLNGVIQELIKNKLIKNVISIPLIIITFYLFLRTVY